MPAPRLEESMLEASSIGACLPGFTGDLAAATALYQSFGSSSGSYADLERSEGVVGIDVVPLVAAAVDEDE